LSVITVSRNYDNIKYEYIYSAPLQMLHFGVRLLASPRNIRLGWKGLPGINTLAYYGYLEITSVKSFIGLTTRSEM
jgi:hypothetical protein